MADGKTRPGVMIYFEAVRPALSRLDNEQCGALFRAIIDYAEYGAVSDLGAMEGMVFDLLRPKIDRDAEKYAESREQRQHAVYVREAKRRGEQPLTLSDWRLYRGSSSDNGPIAPDNEPYPSTTTATAISSTTATSLSTSSSGSSSATGEGKAGEKGCKGEGEGKPEPLYARWLELMDAGDRQAAFAVSNELFKMGFNVDPATKKLSKRA